MSDNDAHSLIGDYGAKDSSYDGNARANHVKALVRDCGASILELGCGNGATGARARREGTAEGYVGIEVVLDMGAQAARIMIEVHCGTFQHEQNAITRPASGKALTMHN